MTQVLLLNFVAGQSDEIVMDDRSEINSSPRQSTTHDLANDIAATQPLESSQNNCENWFIKNIFAEIPIVWELCHTEKGALYTIYRVLKSTVMLVGGSVGMMLDFVKVLKEDSMAIQITKGSINMAIGMWVSVVVYNIIVKLGDIIYNFFKSLYLKSSVSSST